MYQCSILRLYEDKATFSCTLQWCERKPRPETHCNAAWYTESNTFKQDGFERECQHNQLLINVSLEFISPSHQKKNSSAFHYRNSTQGHSESAVDRGNVSVYSILCCHRNTSHAHVCQDMCDSLQEHAVSPIWYPLDAAEEKTWLPS